MSEKEIREMMLEMIRKMDQKLDEHSDTLARIETRMETFVTKEQCVKMHLKKTDPSEPESKNITVTSGKKKIIIPIGIIAAIAAAVVTVIQALS